MNKHKFSLKNRKGDPSKRGFIGHTRFYAGMTTAERKADRKRRKFGGKRI